MTYDGVQRTVEPYSLRYPRTGNTLLYVWELKRGPTSTNQIKAYNLYRFQGVKVTERSFIARYVVEV